MAVYYNEINPFCCEWIKQLIKRGLIPDGEIDSRSIEDVRPDDLKGFTQHHFFAGLAGWAYALRLAGWPDDKPIFSGSCPCFPANTLIHTDKGLIPIQNVQVGDMVLTHKGRWRKVLRTGSEPDKFTFILKGTGHYGIKCTPNHPFLTSEGTWLEAREMVGKYWINAYKIPIGELPKVRTDNVDTASEAFALFLGRWIGDDSTTDALFEKEAWLPDWLADNFGPSEINRHLPGWLLSAPLDYVRAFIRGLQETGAFTAHHIWQIDTPSKALAFGLKFLLLRLHIAVDMFCLENSGSPGYAVNYSTHWLNKPIKGFPLTFNQGEVLSVEPYRQCTVYNLEVEEDNSYVADGIIVHNCQPFSAAGQREGFADERHLWPAFFWLISQCAPDTVVGEQVASSDALTWFDLVRSDMEGAHYACGVLDTCAAGYGAPHIRQRLYWSAVRTGLGLPESGGQSGLYHRGTGSPIDPGTAPGWLVQPMQFKRGGRHQGNPEGVIEPVQAQGLCSSGGLAHATGKQNDQEHPESPETERKWNADSPAGCGASNRLGDTPNARCEGRQSCGERLPNPCPHDTHDRLEHPEGFRVEDRPAGNRVAPEADGQGISRPDCAIPPSCGLDYPNQQGSQGQPQPDRSSQGWEEQAGCPVNPGDVACGVEYPKNDGQQKLPAGRGVVSEHEQGRSRNGTCSAGQVASGVVYSNGSGRDRRIFSQASGTDGQDGQFATDGGVGIAGAMPTNGFWANPDWLWCRDKKWRPIESGIVPLVARLSPGMGRSRDRCAIRQRLQGYGNAIVIPQAVEFIKALMEILNIKPL